MTALPHLAGRGAELGAALVVAAAVSAVTLMTINRIPFPGPSWLPETFGTVLAVVVVAVTAWLLLRRRTGDRTLWALGTVGPAFLASSHLSLILHGTPHYLFGLGGDQANRVAYVTRFADSPALADAFYADAAPFYPPQWFWVGGRLAALFGVDGWAFYKPYSIMTMAVAGAIAFVAWRWLVPARLAVLFGLLTAVIGGHTNAYEPYSWILICLLPQVVVATHLLCARVAGRAAGRRGAPPWPLVVTIGVYLGWAALGYTLIAGFAALVVAIVVALYAWRVRTDRDTVVALGARLAAMAAISAAMALVFWHRYLFAVLGGAETEASVANDFAPEVGSRLPMPMFAVSAAGLLCLIGLAWVVVTVWPSGDGPPDDDDNDNDAAADHADEAAAPAWPLPSPDRALTLAWSLAVLVVAVFAWYLVSGLRSLVGSTLLPFRMVPVITLALALAGVVGALALARWAVTTSPARSRGGVAAVAVVVAGLAAVQMAQHVPEEDAGFAAAARNTPPMPEDVLGVLDDMTGEREPSDLVLLTADPSLYAYRPYFTFQAPAQAYATPAGRYSERLDEVRRWADSRSPAELSTALGSGPFRSPDALVLNRLDDGRYVFPATINVMPRTVNNETEGVVFHPELFADPDHFDVRDVGSRVVIVPR